MTPADKTILLVEDDPIDRMAFERHVRKNGFPYAYRLASSVQEARNILKSEKFDAIILDYMLGDGTAFDLVNEKERSALIVVTGLGDEKVAVAAMKAGAADYLVKDTQGGYLTTLSLTIERAVRNKENERELARYRENLERMVADRTAALATEILRHQKTVNALRESKRNWERTFDAIHDLIIVLDANRIIVRANQAAARIVELPPRELIGKSYHQLFRHAGEETAPCPVDRCLTEKQGCTVEYRYRKDQTHLVSCSPVFAKTGAIETIVLVGKNVSDQKQLEAQLIQAQKLEAIGALAGGIAHDFNNILTGILGYSQMGLRQAEPGSFLHKALDSINSAGLRARDLVRQILTFSRKSPENRKVMQIQPIIKEGLHLLRATIPSTVTIRQRVDPHCGAIRANPVQIHQVLMNLCTNASQAMEKTSGELLVTLQETLLGDRQAKKVDLPAGRYLLLAVQDSGVGIAPEILPRIFEPFFTTKGVGKGTGMGLSVVHGIIKECGGNIGVESKEGVGTLFEVYLPLASPPETAILPDSEPLSSLTGSERILFADDEEQIRLFAKTALEELGYRVQLAADGKEAWQIFSASPRDFDLVITDKTMPEINGLALAEKIRAQRPDLPIILCSGDQTGIIPLMLGSVGIRKFIPKPFVIRDLALAAREALADSQSATPHGERS